MQQLPRRSSAVDLVVHSVTAYKGLRTEAFEKTLPMSNALALEVLLVLLEDRHPLVYQFAACIIIKLYSQKRVMLCNRTLVHAAASLCTPLPDSDVNKIAIQTLHANLANWGQILVNEQDMLDRIALLFARAVHHPAGSDWDPVVGMYTVYCIVTGTMLWVCILYTV
jgi:hypothetical protein